MWWAAWQKNIHSSNEVFYQLMTIRSFSDDELFVHGLLFAEVGHKFTQKSLLTKTRQSHQGETLVIIITK